jgi:acetyl-CoA acetyltransferase
MRRSSSRQSTGDWEKLTQTTTSRGQRLDSTQEAKKVLIPATRRKRNWTQHALPIVRACVFQMTMTHHRRHARRLRLAAGRPAVQLAAIRPVRDGLTSPIANNTVNDYSTHRGADTEDCARSTRRTRFWLALSARATAHRNPNERGRR